MNVPEYIVEDAADIVYENISVKLQRKLKTEHIIEILEIEFEYMKQPGMASAPPPGSNVPAEIPQQLEQSAMEYFIISRCAQKHIYLSQQELQEVLDAETIYLQQLGLADDDDPWGYYN